MANNPGISEVVDKNGVTADIEAKRFDGTRTVQMQGDVTATQTWNGDSNTPLTLNASIGAKKVTQDKIGDKAVGSGQMADGSVGLTQMAASAMTDTVSANNSKLVTSQGVNAAIAAATLNRGKDYGPLSVDEINAISETIPTGSTVYVKSLGASDAKVINDGYSDGTMASFSVDVGEDLKYYRSPDNSVHGWYSTEANVKVKQPANYAGGIAVDSAQDASSGSAGIEFIQSFKQDTNGNIRDIVKAQVDIVDSTSSTRTNAAATPNSVKSTYDLASGKYSKPSGGIPKSDLESGVQGSLDKADSALQGVKLAGAYSELTPDANKVVTIPNAVPTGTGETNGLMTAADKAKLNGIAEGAEANVQSDWNQTDDSADDFIKNKPTKLSDFTDDITQSNYIASGTGSDKPASGAAVAAAVARKISVFDGLVSSGDVGSSQWSKVADFLAAENSQAAGIWIVTYGTEFGSANNPQQDFAILSVNFRGGSTNKPTKILFNLTTFYSWDASNYEINIVTRGRSVELWTRNSGSYRGIQFTQILNGRGGNNNRWNYFATSFTEKPVEDPSNDIYVYEPVICNSRDASWINSGTISDNHIASASTWNGKADKVSGATNGNFAALDSNGNLTDSGKSYSDLEGTFKTRQPAKVSPAASGNTLSFIDTVSQDKNGEIAATKKTVTVDSTYSSAGTNPVNGTAVAAALATSLTDVAYVANQSGGGGNLNKTINGTTTSVLEFMTDSEAVAIWADAKTAAANAS